ncbi:MAG: alpha/beta hydrolase [Dehalococcoidia bacterium]|uniref:alpha/beta hydrolase n=1 Tax=Candidatus Amarobacter glycogenicus TaxID=3140699 RepID=UPI0031366DC9|nr:alpha/beta hydrolase [Dehalococcoidia bacterium]
MKARLVALVGVVTGSAVFAACLWGGAADAKPSAPQPPAVSAVTATPGTGAPSATSAAALSAPSGDAPATRGPRPGAAVPDETVTFCEPVDGVELQMDVYYPDGHTSTGEAPAVVYVHGGGWTSGSRSQGEGTRYILSLLQEGFVVFAVDYRLSPEYLFPAHIQDVQCGIRHIRANADEYGIDPDRIGAIGGSAGGQLVNLLGTAEDGDFDLVGGYEGYSSEVSVVVSMFGASDFSDPNMAGHNAAHTRVFGSADPNSEELQAASAVNYISSDDADFLLLHGEEDPVVPISQSEIFEAALATAGVDVTFIRVEHAGHSFAPTGGTPNPSANQLVLIVAQFFSDHL